MLALLFNFAPLKITYLLAMPVAGLWVGVDAETRIGNGWVWGSIAFACPPLGVPLYYGLLLAQALGNGRRNRELDAQQASSKEQRRRFTAMGAIEREHYLADAQASGGTVYGAPAPGAAAGARHFTDERAEELLAAGDPAAAREYLTDMLALAREQGDSVREQTYRHYLSRLPESR
jgi:hypothetical protein